MNYYNQYEIDKVWEDFKNLIKNGFSINDDVDRRWEQMASTSSQKRLMLMKQQSLRKGKMYIGGLV